MVGKNKDIKLVLLIVVSLVLIYSLGLFGDTSLTGKGVQAIGECLESDQDIDKGRAGYCVDGESFKTDRCSDPNTLLEWYCDAGWCKNKRVDCTKFQGTCQFGACTNSLEKE